MPRINLIFRKLSINHYSIAKLLGLIHQKFQNSDLELKVWLNFDEIKNILLDKCVNVLAYSFMTPLLDQVSYELEQLKQIIGNNDWIIAGGVHPTVDPWGCLKLGFDKVFCSESERTLVVFIKELLAGSAKKNHDKIVKDTNPLPVSLDDYPPFFAQKNFFVPIELTRGCINRCTFCGIAGIHRPQISFRTPEGLKHPFAEMKKRNRKKLFFITSNILSYKINGDTKGHDSLIQLCESALSYGLTDIHLGSFPSEVRPEYIDDGFMKIFDKYCINKTIVIGAQSGSERMLEALNRGHSVQDVKNAALLCRQYKFMPLIDFIFGLPDETKDDIEQTLDLIEWLVKYTGAKIHPHYFISLPGTILWEKKPKPVDVKTRLYLDKLRKHGKLFGDMKSQENLSMKIFSWKQNGKILV